MQPSKDRFNDDLHMYNFLGLDLLAVNFPLQVHVVMVNMLQPDC